jgi:hypothetical protein
MAVSKTLNASSLVSSLGLRRARAEAGVKDEDYVSLGKSSNAKALDSDADEALFRMVHEEETFDHLLDVPFALKHLRDLHAIMRHAVVVLNENREDLTQHMLFHHAFAAFTLGFALGLVEAHRSKLMALRPGMAALATTPGGITETWGVEIATYYLAYVDVEGVFGKKADIDLYGIGDAWRDLANEDRIDQYHGLDRVAAAGRLAARTWFEEESADVPAAFVEAAAGFIDGPGGSQAA